MAAMNKTLLLLHLLGSILLSAQKQQSFIYKHKNITYYRVAHDEGSSLLPGASLHLHIDVGIMAIDSLAGQQNLMQAAGRKHPAVHYFIDGSSLRDDNLAEFIEVFIEDYYYIDFFDRNSATLFLDGNFQPGCEELRKLNDYVATVRLKNTPDCGLPFVKSWDDADGKIYRTAVTYTVATIKEMEDWKGSLKSAEVAAIVSKNLFITASGGYHAINKANKTSFDNETLVDFNRLNTIWSLTAGYYFTPRSAAFANFSFIYSGKQKNVNIVQDPLGQGITVEGSGNAGAIYQVGAGYRYLPYINRRLSIYNELSLGRITAVAGGGTGSTSIGGTGADHRDIHKKKEKAVYADLSVGAIYRAGSNLAFTSALTYNISKFDDPIGSIRSFSGLSFLLGIGIILPLGENNN